MIGVSESTGSSTGEKTLRGVRAKACNICPSLLTTPNIARLLPRF